MLRKIYKYCIHCIKLRLKRYTNYEYTVIDRQFLLACTTVEQEAQHRRETARQLCVLFYF